ncbi:hypothetical protein T01_10601 [Trichinella spiralis]|uniref:Uncharacterized protein n=1 Tax=Trichinella spiralis TaxID=6334 RepID=A0A0V1BUJ5_TRISP|nr:hypothetical protein T01_10601 [Trichinella spiralis]
MPQLENWLLFTILQKNYKAQQIYSKQTLEPSWIFADVLLLLMLMYHAQLQNLSFISIGKTQPYCGSKARLAALGKQTTENSQTYAFSNDLQNALT